MYTSNKEREETPMLELNQDEKRVLEKITNQLRTCDLFNGIYDAKNGDEQFMYGIELVMEYLAAHISDEYQAEFCDTFSLNMLKSLGKALDKKETL
jgi:hypothetical protein